MPGMVLMVTDVRQINQLKMIMNQLLDIRGLCINHVFDIDS